MLVSIQAATEIYCNSWIAYFTLHDLILLRNFMCILNGLFENTSTLLGFYVKVGTNCIYLFLQKLFLAIKVK